MASGGLREGGDSRAESRTARARLETACGGRRVVAGFAGVLFVLGRERLGEDCFFAPWVFEGAEVFGERVRLTDGVWIDNAGGHRTKGNMLRRGE